MIWNRDATHDDLLSLARVGYGSRYMHGWCVALAVAVHRRTDWPLIAIRDGGGSLLHAGCRMPSGEPLDVRGASATDDAFAEYFGGYVVEVTEADLLVEDPKIDEEAIAYAADRLDLLFGDLPGRSAYRERMTAFVEDLETLCRRHGIWLRDEGPHGFVAYPAHEDEETSYKASFDLVGNVRLRRMLG